ncbi:ThiF family adenylyltransferase [Exiguobacterium sp. s193]|uniref:ThiF family adenylyltransferase n=1 Tax=Exiguobacterium sp. s193 TaxID=2751207 RepID=UPI001BEB6FE4|nr:ThiF family adenylyltransferase [Exiguobacterium sp. s193]
MTDRYSRQTRFRPIGQAGQDELTKKHVLIIGMGALGTASAEQLVRAGVGKLTIVDRDYVEWSNLQRQHLYTEDDAAQHVPKAIAAKRRLTAINREVEIEAHVTDVTRYELPELISGVDLILDATDHFDIRMLINDAAAQHKIPWIYGGCVGSYGMTFTIRPNETPCLHCLLEHLPRGQATCETAGVIGPAIQLVAAYQVAEAFKLLIGATDALRCQLLAFDVWTNEQSRIDVASLRKASCPSCGTDRTYPYLTNQPVQFTTLCGRDAVQVRGDGARDLAHLEQNLSPVVTLVAKNDYLLSFKTETHRFVAFRDGRVLIHGEQDLIRAKQLYHAYFG